jgi:hypothetical protein
LHKAIFKQPYAGKCLTIAPLVFKLFKSKKVPHIRSSYIASAKYLSYKCEVFLVVYLSADLKRPRIGHIKPMAKPRIGHMRPRNLSLTG